jgi:hypothetical protein
MLLPYHVQVRSLHFPNLWSVIQSASGCKPGSLLGALVIQSNTHCCRQLTELLLHFSEAIS